MMRRAVSDLGLPLVQYGVRALCTEEVAFRREAGVTHWDAAQLARSGVPARPLPDDFPESVYVTFDVDGLDPSIMPATGTPVPGGLGWYDALRLVERSVSGRRVLGFDVVELADDLDGLVFSAGKPVQIGEDQRQPDGQAGQLADERQQQAFRVLLPCADTVAKII